MSHGVASEREYLTGPTAAVLQASHPPLQGGHAAPSGESETLVSSSMMQAMVVGAAGVASLVVAGVVRVAIIAQAIVNDGARVAHDCCRGSATKGCHEGSGEKGRRIRRQGTTASNSFQASRSARGDQPANA